MRPKGANILVNETALCPNPYALTLTLTSFLEFKNTNNRRKI